MSYFSIVSIANENELIEKYRTLNIMGNRFRELVTPYLPDFVYGVVENIGVPDYDVKGCRICVPKAGKEDEFGQKKIKKAIDRSKRLGADVAVIDPSLDFENTDSSIRISRGNLYTPYAIIEALKVISALMRIDFKRCNICIADASNALGILVTELLIEDAAYLTLCTSNKDKIMGRIDKYVLESGISPAVISNYKKAVSSCDILIYTGDANIKEVSSFVNKKMLLANLTSEKIELEKDLLTIDEVILLGQNEPVISGKNVDKETFLTSRVWEGVLLSNLDMDTRKVTAKKAAKLGELSQKLGLKITSITGKGKKIDKSAIYKYR